MKQIISRNEMDEIVQWSNTPEQHIMESEEDCEELFIVEEIEAI